MSFFVFQSINKPTKNIQGRNISNLDDQPRSTKFVINCNGEHDQKFVTTLTLNDHVYIFVQLNSSQP